jgi:hypothetical protein
VETVLVIALIITKRKQKVNKDYLEKASYSISNSKGFELSRIE